ncbi:GGDEF domain-containing protein [Aquisalimonas sp. 2447]|uniref:GGDEF domain-containing protein n=1 Tax=Aquisalimonas sp. 2447 TaxID=2740807 RepID=UPI0014324174|nr:GGDEF domain-containing protein [Aquisalimonas sp. 2447]
MLRQLGQLLSHSSRAGDTVGRWGGEEFTLLMPDTLAADARSGALALSRLVATHSFALPRGITLSCGITEVADNDSIRALMRRADRALYRAKENGKNQVDVELVR